SPFLFTEQASKEFDALKKAFTMAPILTHFSELARTLIETNASDYAVAGVISHLSEPFEVLTDHNALKYFISSKVLTRRQARWAEFLSKFCFTINYQPVKLAVVLDALSR
ncbi:putative retrovirus polyprotein, partial [Puccinia sorghi]